MMVLAVHVAAHRASYRDELRARRDRQKPTFRDDHIQDLVEGETALALKDAVFDVK